MFDIYVGVYGSRTKTLRQKVDKMLNAKSYSIGQKLEGDLFFHNRNSTLSQHNVDYIITSLTCTRCVRDRIHIF